MPKAQGYAYITEPGQAIRETDCFTCNHCNSIIHSPVNKKIEEVGDFCRSCMKVICLRCAGKGCRPFLKQVEAQEERAFRLREYGI